MRCDRLMYAQDERLQGFSVDAEPHQWRMSASDTYTCNKYEIVLLRLARGTGI